MNRVDGYPLIDRAPLNQVMQPGNVEQGNANLFRVVPSYQSISSPLYQVALGYFLSPIVSLLKSQVTGSVLNQSFSVIQTASIEELYSSIVNMSTISITGPVIEEIIFRGIIYDVLKKGFKSFYTFCSVPPNLADTLSKVSAIFFSAVIFGMAHFMNAYALNSSFMTVYPQVIYATIGGLIYGCLREYTQDIYLPIGLHMGNNIMAWENSAISSLAKVVKSLGSKLF